MIFCIYVVPAKKYLLYFLIAHGNLFFAFFSPSGIFPIFVAKNQTFRRLNAVLPLFSKINSLCKA